MQRVLRAFWPMVAWMGVVFTMSTSVGEPAHSSRIIDPIVRLFDPTVSAATLEVFHTIGRKLGHITEYAVLAVLIWRALRILRANDVPGWSWPLAAWALGASAAYGATDEIHQIFVPTRGPSVHDVLIDSSGAALGLLIVYLWTRRVQARAAEQAAA